MNNLIVLEGFDRTGKNSIAEACYNTSYTILDKTPNKPDHFGDPTVFAKWVKEYAINELDMMISLNTNIFRVRWMLSEYVYSTLFSRTSIVDAITAKSIQHFNVKNIVLLFDTYASYIRRVTILNDVVEYTEQQFNTINKLYYEAMNKYTTMDNVVYFINADDKPKKDINKFIAML